MAYVRGKHADSAKLGVRSIRRDLPADISQRELLDVIAELNADPECDGFIVQLPLPGHLEQGEVLEAVDPAKDVDGLHPVNLGRLVLNEPAPRPCTPVGVVRLLEHYGVPTDGAQVVVVGRGVTVGRPLGLLLSQRAVNATVTLCHTGTRDLAAEVRRADIVIAAAGVPGLVTADMVKPGAAVVDVGISRTADGLVGDVDPAAQRDRRLVGAGARRSRPDDQGDAAVQHGGRRRASAGGRWLTDATARRSTGETARRTGATASPWPW